MQEPVQEIVKLENVTKTFPGVKALDQVTLSIRSGEVLALVGENGAGKSTLMKVLSGVYPKGSFDGEILLDGEPVNFQSPLEAEKAGIAIIHQELASFQHLTVAENLFVGHWPKNKKGLVDWVAMETEAQIWLEQVGAECKPTDLMGSLSVGSQQMVEIAKALSRKSRVLILDEPTSALTTKEVEKLFKVIKNLRSQGCGLVYISHKMEEIYELADRMTVLRDGQSVHTSPAAELTHDDLISHMVGRTLDRLFPDPPERKFGSVVLRVNHLEGYVPGGPKKVGPISFDLKAGEILGFSGLLGSGRTELMKMIFGDTLASYKGEIRLNGQATCFTHPQQALRHHIAFVAEDRKRESIFAQRSLEENISLARLSKSSQWSIINQDQEFDRADQRLKSLSTKCTGPDMEVQNLSGGNQQKVIIGRALEVDPNIIILDEPTRGVDVGAKFEIYEILFELAKQGKALLVVSSDLPELMALSDRIIVLAEGRQMGTLTRSDFSEEEIMKLAVGGRE